MPGAMIKAYGSAVEDMNVTHWGNQKFLLHPGCSFHLCSKLIASERETATSIIMNTRLGRAQAEGKLYLLGSLKKGDYEK